MNLSVTLGHNLDNLAIILSDEGGLLFFNFSVASLIPSIVRYSFSFGISSASLVFCSVSH
jgi:hypothetical protein